MLFAVRIRVKSGQVDVCDGRLTLIAVESEIALAMISAGRNDFHVIFVDHLLPVLYIKNSWFILQHVTSEPVTIA